MKRLYWLLPLLCTVSCSGAQVKETAGNAYDSLCEGVAAAAKDPSTLFSPAGAITTIALVGAGFFSKQSASLAKWAGKKTVGAAKKLSKKEQV